MRTTKRGLLSGVAALLTVVMALGALASGGQQANAATVTVQAVITNSFVPNVTTINAGDTVNFVNAGGVHTATSVQAGLFDVSLLAAGSSGSKVFDAPGTYYYFCAVHSDAGAATEANVVANSAMVGKIVVQGEAPAATATTAAPTATTAAPTATTAAPTATTAAPTATTAAPTATTAAPTATTVPPTATVVSPTATPVPPTATAVPPTATAVPPTATSVPPTATTAPANTPTAVATAAAPTATPRPPATGTGLDSGAGPSSPLFLLAIGTLAALAAGGAGVAVVARRRID